MGLFRKDNRKDQIISYQNGEIRRLENNLKRLANGEFDFDLSAAEGAGRFESEKEQYTEINQHLSKIRQS